MADTAFINSATYDALSVKSVTVSKPTDTAEDDIMFCLLSKTGENEAVTAPDGWSLLGSVAVSGGFYGFLYYKVAGASEPADYTWSWVNTNAGAKCTIATYRGGFDIADSIDVVSNTGYTVNNTTVRAASMDVASESSNLIFAGFVWDYHKTRTFTKPSEQDNDWVEDYDAGDWSSGFYQTFDHCNWSGSGASGVMDAILSAGGTYNRYKHAFAVALKVEGGAPPEDFGEEMMIQQVDA